MERIDRHGERRDNSPPSVSLSESPFPSLSSFFLLPFCSTRTGEGAANRSDSLQMKAQDKRKNEKVLPDSEGEIRKREKKRSASYLTSLRLSLCFFERSTALAVAKGWPEGSRATEGESSSSSSSSALPAVYGRKEQKRKKKGRKTGRSDTNEEKGRCLYSYT